MFKTLNYSFSKGGPRPLLGDSILLLKSLSCLLLEAHFKNSSITQGIIFL